MARYLGDWDRMWERAGRAEGCGFGEAKNGYGRLCLCSFFLFFFFGCCRRCVVGCDVLMGFFLCV